jgi:lysozyme family protein
MNSNWDFSFKNLIQHEGGFSNYAADPGGRTNFGVTQEVWEDWVGRLVSEDEIRNLTPEKVEPLYKEMYWDKLMCDRLPPGVDYCVFDASVNSGTFRAAKWLQLTIGAKQDGVIGNLTINLASLTNPQMTIDKFCATRLEFLKSLSNWPSFGNGWERRIHEVQETANQMCKK